MIAFQKSTPFNRARHGLFSKKPRFHDVYELGEVIKLGGSGTVFRATLKHNAKEEFAVKVVDRTKLSKTAEQEILHEVDIMREVIDLEHTNKVVDFFVSRKTFRIVQKLATGGNVQDWVMRHGSYSETNARVFAINLLKSIQELHGRRICHRDIKLANILLETPKDNTRIVLADWGYAARFNAGEFLTKACGTPTTIAPEILAENPCYTQSVDMWSAGCVIYSILSGRAPFVRRCNESWDIVFQRIQQGEYRSLDHKGWDGVSDEAKDFVRGLLTVDPNKRWTADEALRSAWILKRQDTVEGGHEKLLPQYPWIG